MAHFSRCCPLSGAGFSKSPCIYELFYLGTVIGLVVLGCRYTDKRPVYLYCKVCCFCCNGATLSLSRPTGGVPMSNINGRYGII